MTSRTPLILSAKMLRRMVRLMGGHGSALPGAVVARLDKRFLHYTLSKLPLGVVVVTGTNGKTTTTRMLVELLKAQELRVLSNGSGSNLLRGLISTVIEHTSSNGELPYDIAVFEVDEANAPLFTEQISPVVLVALNVMRDQLDRYGEIETTASLIARAATSARNVVVNGNDPLLFAKTAAHPHRITFGLSEGLVKRVSSEATLYADSNEQVPSNSNNNDVKIVDIKTTKKNTQAIINCNGESVELDLPMLGAHNIVNASAAIITTNIILPAARLSHLAATLDDFKPAFGRGETTKIHDRDITVALIKNPSGFTQNVRTFITKDVDALLIVINDSYADGRDVSWLWDSQLNPLKEFRGAIFLAGVRRYDMALRLKYAGIPYQIIDEEAGSRLMKKVMSSSAWASHLLIIPTYTAMLAIQKWLRSAQGEKRIW